MHYLKTPGALYNEFDPKAAAWLRELIKRGLIADGEVDERSIIDVAPDDVRFFTQCHWFAGLGGWSKALRFAGWPDDEPVWTGSPPCQPFSAAGQQRGSADERHLAPHFAELIASVRPSHVFGEQVASAAVFGKPAKGARGEAASQPEWAWIDDLFGRLEAAHYACGASDIPAAGVGAPHLRQRTFFVGVRVADACGNGSQGWVRGRADSEWQGVNGSSGRDGAVVGLALATLEQRDGGRFGRTSGWVEHTDSGGVVGLDHSASARHIGSVLGSEGYPRDEARLRVSGAGRRDIGLEHPAGDGRESRRPEPSGRGIVGGRGDSGLEDALHAERRSVDVNGTDGRDGQDAGREEAHGFVGTRGEVCGRPSPTDGFWRDAEWLFCRDGKWRPVEPGTFPLAHGASARVGRLRAYGNSINAKAGEVLIECVMDSIA